MSIKSFVKMGESHFDKVLKQKWKECEEKGLFRYILNIQDSKILDGRYQFLAQLNVDRGYKRRTPSNIVSMRQPFDESSFNFTKLAPEEEIMRLDSKDEEDIIAINVSPIERYHSMLLPQRNKKLPQIVTKHSLYKALEVFSLSSSVDIRVGFNSLCGYATVNHLHWHLYYLEHRMLLEHIDLEQYAGPVQVLKDFPAKGFCIKYSTVRSLDEFVDWAYLVVNHLQNSQIAHNVYITRAKLNGDELKDLRMYIWARKSCTGIKNMDAFLPAMCELFGHLTIKSNEAYERLTEEYVANVLEDLTGESFLLACSELKGVIENHIK